MDRAIYDRMAEIDAEHWWFSARRRIVATLIAQQVPLKRGARILEVGAGTGSNLTMLQRFGEVDAIEPDEAARALASRRGGFAVGGGMLPDGVQLVDGRYDLIVLLDVLEHVERDRASLRVLRAKLAPGGRLLLTVPAAPWLWSAHDVKHHHKRRYTRQTLHDTLFDGGFEVRHISHFNTLLYPLVAAARIVARMTGRQGDDDAMPPLGLNGVLERIFASERYWVARGSLPLGVSLLAVAEPAAG